MPVTANPNARPDRNLEAKVLTTAPKNPPATVVSGGGVMIGSNLGTNSNTIANRGGAIGTSNNNPTSCSTAHRNAGANSGTSATSVPENLEFCELCGQSFSDISDLILHVEHLHLSSGNEISSR